MSTKIFKLALIALITFALIGWLRVDGFFDFDIRAIVPFMRGDVTIHDWGALALIILGCWGAARLRRGTRDQEDVVGPESDPREIYPPLPRDNYPWRERWDR